MGYIINEKQWRRGSRRGHSTRRDRLRRRLFVVFNGFEHRFSPRQAARLNPAPHTLSAFFINSRRPAIHQQLERLYVISLGVLIFEIGIIVKVFAVLNESTILHNYMICLAPGRSCAIIKN